MLKLGQLCVLVRANLTTPHSCGMIVLIAGTDPRDRTADPALSLESSGSVASSSTWITYNSDKLSDTRHPSIFFKSSTGYDARSGPMLRVLCGLYAGEGLFRHSEFMRSSAFIVNPREINTLCFCLTAVLT